MKVLHVIPSVALWRGGPSAAIRVITRGLARQGLDTHVATTDDNRPTRLNVPLQAPVDEDGVIYHYFPRQIRYYICSAPFAAWLWRHVGDYDVIHIHTIFSYCPTVAAWIASQKGVPYIIRPAGMLSRWGFHNGRPGLKRSSFALVEKLLLSRAAAVQYTTEQEREEATDLKFSHHAVVIPNPVEWEASAAFSGRQFRSQYSALADRPIILFLSRIHPKKGVDLLLPAFREVLREHPTAALVIVGDGDTPSMVQDLRRLASSLGIADSVFWPGFLGGSAKVAALAAAEVFVLPSYSENFGMAPVEAMSMGIPVVVTDQVGIHKEISAGRAGIVTPPAIAPLASALKLLLREAGLRAEMGRNAARLAATRYSVEAVASQLIDLYSTLCPQPVTGALPSGAYRLQ
jgi:glycosyltransferase involved in cell wall biosynthesis